MNGDVLQGLLERDRRLREEIERLGDRIRELGDRTDAFAETPRLARELLLGYRREILALVRLVETLESGFGTSHR